MRASWVRCSCRQEVRIDVKLAGEAREFAGFVLDALTPKGRRPDDCPALVLGVRLVLGEATGRNVSGDAAAAALRGDPLPGLEGGDE
jgi:hypothetical protein